MLPHSVKISAKCEARFDFYQAEAQRWRCWLWYLRAKKLGLGVGTVHRIKREMTAAPDLLCLPILSDGTTTPSRQTNP
jgi:hypothetical protein